ncbi:V-type ATP synthase subunit I [Helicovermis profundi]|uniref:V-type ATPase 116kDa subunit family protein n=1 Tax=Helicovermis profundi TaxID=3065157 RepID=A0AAU9E800_9FIRM|nr:V-type ATPase 116kDa subunit family protein [Clostridia bacterium S502]
MAIEKMKMMNMVGHIDSMDSVLKKVMALKNVQLLNAFDEIDDVDFTLDIDEKYEKEVVDLCRIKPHREKAAFRMMSLDINNLMDIMQLKKQIELKYYETEYNDLEISKSISMILKEMEDINKETSTLNEKLKVLNELKVIERIRDINVDFDKVFNLNVFDVNLGRLTPENRVKFTKNYENVPALVMHVGEYENEEVYLVVSPKEFNEETTRILKSVYFKQIWIPEEFLSTPRNMIIKINKEIEDIINRIDFLKNEAKDYKNKYGENIIKCYSVIEIEKNLSRMKSKIAVTRNFFYLAGWIPQNLINNLEKSLSVYGEGMILIFKDVSEVKTKVRPPTLLSNSWLFKPFEILIEMYGMPSYSEIDPTPFIGFVYMLLFGAMFGDLGQGFVIFLAGILLIKVKNADKAGGLLSRIGISSMLFGFLYDSFFGYEEVISKFVVNTLHIEFAEKIFLRPIENINTMLMYSIGLGILLLISSFGLSIYNKLKSKDIAEGIFGRNGIVGLILYITMIAVVFGSFKKMYFLPPSVLFTIVVITLILMVVREPLANLITDTRPLYHESAGEYYVESGFNLLETFLGMLSNSVSFIRVGAFALNHVGLFIAFHTIANIIGTSLGEVSMFIVGNIMVLMLEGLIVFIQGLRLVYYELFSKYYTGDGVSFEPEVLKISK